MVFGYQTEIFEDKKSRKIFHIKNTNINYLLKEEDEFKVRLFKMNIVNSLSIAVIVKFFLVMPIYGYVVIAGLIYIAYLFYFNNKVLPDMKRIKKVEHKFLIEQAKVTFPYVSLAYLTIGLGLIYCMFTNQVASGTMTLIVISAIAVSFGIGGFYLLTYYMR